MPGSSHSELMPGSLLGKYRIERLLGHGGMATVYLAVQEGTGLEVALKVLMFRGESNRPGGDVARFIREARLAGGIRHPHWVSVYETGYDSKQNLYYIAMERMQASLANRLRAHGPLPEAEAIAVVEQIALALDKAYETQMVHRDIKPANILYNAAGVCKLTDFGIAKSSRNEETQLTLREAVFGTPAYMSPEQAKDARMVDTRSDIYSLGTVFFELLSGERPYQGETPVQVLAQVITDKPPPDVRSKPKARKIHSDTAKLVACMMAKDPAARPQTPADLIARLQKLKAHMPYAKPEESAEEPEYDDSTIMDPTNPPPTDVMLDAGFPSDPGTVRAPTGGAGHTGMWDGAPTGGGNTGGGTGGGVTGTGGGAFGAGAGDEPRTAVSLPTFSTQAVRDATGTVGTVATMGTRFGDAVGRPVAAAAAKKRSGKSAAGKVWLAVAALLLLLLAGGGYFAAKNDFIARHAGEPGLLGDICRLVYSGPAEPVPPPPRPEPPPAPEPAPAPEPEPAPIPDAPAEPLPATLRFHNPHEVQIHVDVETDGVQTDRFEVEGRATVERTVRGGAAAAIRYHARFTTLYKETDAGNAKTASLRPASGGTEDVELVLTPADDALVQTATLRFHNPYDTSVHVETSGGLVDRFDVAANATEVRTVRGGVATIVRYYARYSGLYAETEAKPGETKVKPKAGEEKPVELVLTRKVSASDKTATLTFRNPLDTAVKVETSGGLADRFEVPAKGTETRQARAGAATTVRFEVPFSGLYGTGETNVTGTATIELALARKALSDAQAVLRLSNPNDADVVVVLKGGRDDEVLVVAGATKEVSVRPGVKTDLRYYATKQQYAENSAETAKTGAATPRGGESASVDLGLTKRTYPDLQLANGGDVALAVRVAGQRDHVALPAGETQTVPVYAERKFSIEWEAEEDGYLDGSRELGPYEWNKRYTEKIVPERRTPPSLRVRNVTLSRGMVVTVTRASDGGVVETFELGKGSNRVVQLPEAGRYRVQTKAKPDKRNDEEQDATRYDAIDEAVDCDWGKTKEVKCTANLRSDGGPGPGPGPDPRVLLREALTTCLSNAKMKVDEEWGEHGAVGAIAVVRDALQEAAAMGMDVDVIAGSTVPWAGWKEAVAAKRSYQTGNAEWQRIVAATEASGSWTEFFGRYPVQTRTY
ncbi:MAG: serine/threonine protein kinase [Kiritimatiellae bacterium]|nr:serine/threonine protein kinase [Kiritimatiellia bacterium]